MAAKLDIGSTVYVEAYPGARWRKPVKLISVSPEGGLAVIELDASYYWQKPGAHITRRMELVRNLHATDGAAPTPA